MDLSSALEMARKPGEACVVEVKYKLKRVLLYYIDGWLSHVKVETIAGEVITGRSALEKIINFGDNYLEVNVRRAGVHELFKITASYDIFEEGNIGYEQLRAFFFYITPQEVALLTHLAFRKNNIPAKQIPWREAIFDLWENRVVEFNGFFLHLPASRVYIVKRLLREHLKRCLTRMRREDVENLKKGKLYRNVLEFLTKEGFTLLDRELPKELLQGIKDLRLPEKEKLMEKYNITKPDIEDIRRLLEEE